MNLFTRALSKIFKSSNQQELNRIKPIIAKINEFDAKFANISDAKIKEIANSLKQQAKKGKNLEAILPESFALVREASKRAIGEKHYDVQLAGGIILHEGKIAEMKTGEGKTLVATLPAFLNSLSGKGVHIVTVNDYLAKRDSEWMGKIFQQLGVSTGCVVSNLEDYERKKNYDCEITYGTNNEFGFDYLRDNMKYDLKDIIIFALWMR